MSITPEIFHKPTMYALFAMHIANGLLQLLNGLDLLSGSSYGYFAAGLIIYLLHAVNQFVRMLFFLPKK